MPAIATMLYRVRRFEKTDLCGVMNVERRVSWSDDPDPVRWRWADFGDHYRMPASTHRFWVVEDVIEGKIWAFVCFVESNTEVRVKNWASISQDANSALWRAVQAMLAGRAFPWDCPGAPVPRATPGVSS